MHAIKAVGLTKRYGRINAVDGLDLEVKAGELFAEMAEQLLTESGNPALTQAIKREKSLYQIACKAAIKGGRSYDDVHIEWIVDKVMQMPDITVCPHGRPIAMEITKSQLDRRFDRLK